MRPLLLGCIAAAAAAATFTALAFAADGQPLGAVIAALLALIAVIVAIAAGGRE